MTPIQGVLLMTYWFETLGDQKDTWHWVAVDLSLAQLLLFITAWSHLTWILDNCDYGNEYGGVASCGTNCQRLRYAGLSV